LYYREIQEAKGQMDIKDPVEMLVPLVHQHQWVDLAVAVVGMYVLFLSRDFICIECTIYQRDGERITIGLG
jgi:hypothetical protein